MSDTGSAYPSRSHPRGHDDASGKSATSSRHWPNRHFLHGMFTNYRRLLGYVRPYRGRLIVAAVILVVNSLLGLVLPWVVQNVVDTVFVDADLRLLNQIAGGLLALFLVQAMLGFVQTYMLTWVAERVVLDLRSMLYTHLHDMSLRFFASMRVGELISRLGNDVMTIQEAVTSTLLNLISQSILFVGGLVIILLIDWRLTLLMLAVVPLATVAMLIMGRVLRRISTEVQDALADTSAAAEEAFSGVRIVKSFAREPFEVARYGEGLQRLFSLALRRAKIRATLGPLIGLLGYTSIVVVLWFGGREVIQGRLSPGQLVSFLLYTIIVASPIAGFTTLYGQLQQALGASERLFDLLDSPIDMQDAPGAVPLPPIEGAVQFEHVSFDYGESDEVQEVLRDVSLIARPGHVVALVGPSGAGKTTLVNLIPRFYDPAQGRVLIDGHDIREVQIRSLREQIGIVPQETTLFAGTIHENIAYGKLGATDGEIEDAARAANAHEFILQAPQGYNTLVGERGIKLSGGQRQRIAIARALLKDPRILILDEATSSLDSESEQAVQDALERLMRHRTTFVVAHRFSTIVNADWIVVLEHGRLVEQGSHADLMRHEDGLYRRLYRLQFHWDGSAGESAVAAVV